MGTNASHRRRRRGDGHLASERAFEATGWRDIADRSGVRMGLLRQCSSRADLGWIRVETVRWPGIDPPVTVSFEAGTA